VKLPDVAIDESIRPELLDSISYAFGHSNRFNFGYRLRHLGQCRAIDVLLQVVQNIASNCGQSRQRQCS
jgi:hypothetical protein